MRIITTNAGEIHYWRSISGFEVDFILADKTAIEIKASRYVGQQDLKSLKVLQEEKCLEH